MFYLFVAEINPQLSWATNWQLRVRVCVWIVEPKARSGHHVFRNAIPLLPDLDQCVFRDRDDRVYFRQFLIAAISLLLLRMRMRLPTSSMMPCSWNSARVRMTDS